MALECFDIEVQGEQLRLHPAGAVLWPERSTFIVADPHFGTDDITDLQRLSGLMSEHACTRLVVLAISCMM